MAQAQPVVLRIGLAGVRQVGLRAVADEEQVAQHLHRVALLALAEQRRHRHAEMLALQIEQRRFDRRHGVDGGAQIEGLQTATAGVAVCETGAAWR